MTDQTFVTMAELVAEGFGASVHAGPSIDTLGAQLGDDVVLDDLGRQCVSRDRARRLFAERASQQQAAPAREATAPGATNDLHAGLRARRERQLALRREHPELSAYEVAALDSGDVDDRLASAGRTFDELMAANRRGVAGVMHRFTPQKG